MYLLLTLGFFSLSMPFYKNPQQQVNFLKDLIDINKDTRILDLGYGEGFHLTKLQELSDFVYGYDKKINNEDSSLPNTQKLNFFEEDWDLQNLDLIYCFAPEFGDDWDKFDQLISKVSANLKPGGKFVFDLFDWNSIAVGTLYKDWFFPTETRIAVNKYKRSEKVATCFRTILLPDTEKFRIAKKYEINWRIFDRDELIEIMNRVGLKLTGEFYSFDLNQPGNWNPQVTRKRLVVVFEKE